MKINRNKGIIGSFATLALATLACVIKRKYIPKIPLNEYKQACLEFAVIDDEICRNELMGNTIVGEEIVFDSKGATVQYRYELFREMYIGYTRKMLEEEREKLYTRLAESKQYADMEKQELECGFIN